MSAIENTLVMIKPDAVARGLVTKIEESILARDLAISRVGVAYFKLKLVQRFYQWDVVKCPEVVLDYLCTHPIALWVISGNDAINRMMETKLRLRRELCTGDHRNLLHCSSSQDRFEWEYDVLQESGMIK